MNLRRHRRLALLVIALVAVAVAASTAFGASTRKQNDTVTVDTLPIANAFPLTLGVQKGFFAKQGIDIKTVTFQSGNDIVLALANHQGDIGYIGYVPAMIARTQGIPVTVVAASEDEGATVNSNWQDVIAKSSSITKPSDLVGKTVALNALKGVGETVVKAALFKDGVNPDGPKYVAMPFPAMIAAINSGQVDAAHLPEPFHSQALAQGMHVVLAPGPTLGKYWPNGCYVALHDFTTHKPGLTKRFRTAMNQSLLYAANHPDEVRAALPPAVRNIILPTWSPLIDRKQLLQLAKYAKQFGVIPTLPNFTQLVPSVVKSGGPKVAPKKKK
jgi:NitT/TauT family transport system substrate-binding protein